MILSAILFFVSYLLYWDVNKQRRICTYEVVDKKAYEDSFTNEVPLDKLIKKKIVKAHYTRTKYFWFAVVCLCCSIGLVLLKLYLCYE